MYTRGTQSYAYNETLPHGGVYNQNAVNGTQYDIWLYTMRFRSVVIFPMFVTNNLNRCVCTLYKVFRSFNWNASTSLLRGVFYRTFSESTGVKVVWIYRASLSFHSFLDANVLAFINVRLCVFSNIKKSYSDSHYILLPYSLLTDRQMVSNPRRLLIGLPLRLGSKAHPAWRHPSNAHWTV